MTPPEKSPSPATKAPLDDQTTGLPGFRSWRAVYIFVFGTFLAYVVLLAAFTMYYSR